MFLPKELEMAKQVVIETRSGKSKVNFLGFDENGKKMFRSSVFGPDVKIETSYVFDADLIGKKEREEVTIGNVTKYWVYVPETIEGVVQSYAEKKDVITARRKIKAEKKKATWNNLQEEKIARMDRYRAMIEKDGFITPDHKDIESAQKLQKLSNRAQNKKLCKLV